ncbi:MAG: hypothetical protein IPK68_22410 [Bdellovibrionales bacterium]|nr:hypothetical protein [Bdellovibrionales bacterium]
MTFSSIAKRKKINSGASSLTYSYPGELSVFETCFSPVAAKETVARTENELTVLSKTNPPLKTKCFESFLVCLYASDRTLQGQNHTKVIHRKSFCSFGKFVENYYVLTAWKLGTEPWQERRKPTLDLTLGRYIPKSSPQHQFDQFSQDLLAFKIAETGASCSWLKGFLKFYRTRITSWKIAVLSSKALRTENVSRKAQASPSPLDD